MKTNKGLRFIAVFEASKGLLALIVSLGLVELLHKDIQDLVYQLTSTLHLDMHNHLLALTFEEAKHISPDQIKLFIGLVLTYAGVRFLEAWGLWFNRRWAEWFAALSGSIYLPFEIYELFQNVSWIKITITLINIGIVLYVAKDLLRESFRRL